MQRDLVVRAMAMEHAAFDELARTAIRRLYAVAHLILRDAELAEDATQETLVLAWSHIRGLRDPDRFDAWLHRLLVRECYRQDGRRRRRTAVEGRVRSIATASADPGQQLAVRDQLERGFLQLELEPRTALVLHHYLGYSFPEISATLGIPVGTAKSRVHRAIVAMRAAIDSDGENPRVFEGRPA